MKKFKLAAIVIAALCISLFFLFKPYLKQHLLLKQVAPVKKNLPFNGVWGVFYPPSYTPHLLEIKEGITFFAVDDNQLDLMCINTYDHDTLLLYVKSVDCGSGFQSHPFTPPDSGSLFAKCYLKDTGLHIIYTQKQFQDNIEDMQLSTVAYKNINPKDTDYIILAAQQ